MAAPITHIVLALKILTLLPDTVDRQEFILGTSFPDIRYMANLSRETTHIEPLAWSDVKTSSSSFRAGMLFHNLVDILRINHFEPAYYNRYAPQPYTPSYCQLFPLAMKFAEDIALYDYVSDWSSIAHYFDQISPAERVLCPDESVILKWHTALQEYLQTKPTLRTAERFLEQTGSALNFSNPTKFDAESAIITLLGNFKFHTDLRRFYENFVSLLPATPVITPPIT